MNNHHIAPSRIVVMVVFALSCFGLLLFLWNSFGGPAPLKSKGYRVEIPFRQAGQLVAQADVRISGVPVGKVAEIRPEDDVTLAVVELDQEYAPLPRDARATLRQKTLLGETYLELTPGSSRAAKLPEGGRLAPGQVKPQVELDQILESFDPGVREDLAAWLTAWGRSVDGRAGDISDTVGELPVLADRAAGVLGVLDRQRSAVRRLVADGSGVFDTIARRGADIRTIVGSGNRVLATTAARPRQIRETVRGLPGLLTSLRRLTVAQRGLFEDIAPAARGLQPAAGRLDATLADAERLAPELTALAPVLQRLNRAAPKGMPAARALLREAGPTLAQLEPLASALTPMVDFVKLYRREFVSSWANIVGTSGWTQTSPNTGDRLGIVRILVPVDDETLIQAETRSPTLRSNPYRAPGGLEKFASGLESFSCRNTSNPTVIPKIGGQVPCVTQKPFEFDGRTQAFPHAKSRELSKSGAAR